MKQKNDGQLELPIFLPSNEPKIVEVKNKLILPRKHTRVTLGTIYMIINILTWMRYIGRTIKDPPIKRIKEHRAAAKKGSPTRLHTAIRDFGWKYFRVQWLHYMDIPEEKLPDLERFYIKQLRTQEEDLGYNMTPGGPGADPDKMSNIKKQWWTVEKNIANNSGIMWFKGEYRKQFLKFRAQKELREDKEQELDDLYDGKHLGKNDDYLRIYYPDENFTYEERDHWEQTYDNGLDFNDDYHLLRLFQGSIYEYDVFPRSK